MTIDYAHQMEHLGDAGIDCTNHIWSFQGHLAFFRPHPLPYALKNNKDELRFVAKILGEE